MLALPLVDIANAGVEIRAPQKLHLVTISLERSS